MAPSDNAGCSGTGNPLTTLSKLTLQDRSGQQDKLVEKSAGFGGSFRSKPEGSSAESEKVDLNSIVTSTSFVADMI